MLGNGAYPCESVQAAQTEHHRRGDPDEGNLFSHDAGGHKSKTKVSVGLVSSEASLQPVDGGLLPASPPLSASSSPLLARTPVRLEGGHPNDFILTESPLQRPCLQTQSYPEVLEVGASAHGHGGRHSSAHSPGVLSGGQVMSGTCNTVSVM